MNTTTNPYPLNYGYQDKNEMLTIGYGLTISSIQHWLFKHQLNCEMKKFDEATNDLADTINGELTNQLIKYVQTANANPQNLLIYQSPQPNVKSATIANINEINQALIQSINVLYRIPQTLQHELAKFIEQYADTIAIVDYE